MSDIDARPSERSSGAVGRLAVRKLRQKGVTPTLHTYMGLTIAGDDAGPFAKVFLPVRNEAAMVDRRMDALVDQTYPADRLEILVLDCRSDDRGR